MQDRRSFLKAAGVTLAAVGLAGCNASAPDEATTTNADAGGTAADPADAAVAAQWNVYRARLGDAATLGSVDEADAGARLAAAIFADFEAANGEYGAHERLEAASETHYEGFEAGAVGLREALADGNAAAARQQYRSVVEHLRAAQRALVGDRATAALDALAYADRAGTAAAFAAADHPTGAAVTANAALTTFEDAPAHEALESDASDAYEAFEDALGDALTAGQRGETAAAEDAAVRARSAAIDGAYAVATGNAVNAGRVASVQARAYDAAAVATLGGPPTAFAHAATLAAYRARVYDAAWLVETGETDAAAAAAIDVLEHFEGARAHEALEDADHDAYEEFEDGVKDLQAAIQSGGDVAGALGEIDANLVAGTNALATSTGAAVLEAGFLRARLADAQEQYRRGEREAAAGVVEAVFERFERDELGVHEALEGASADLYESFEETHLGALPDAMRSGDDDAVTEHVDGALADLLAFEGQAAGEARVSGGESVYLAARTFDAGALASLGDRERAAAVAEAAMAHFEDGAGGFHEAVEHADEERYHAFEEALVGAREAADGSGDAYAAARSFFEQSVGATYAVVAAAGGEQSGAAADVVRTARDAFADSRAGEALGDDGGALADALDAYATGLEAGDASVDAVARAALQAQFAVVGAPKKTPAREEESGEGESDLSGGPNVVEGVPEDADHVVEVEATAFEPGELTVSAGDTVAWKHAGGEAHTVTAREDGLPEGASYWASGGFEHEAAAREGWEDGEGAVQSGQSFVHTFETTGTHAYVCLPHESLGMEGTVVVEEQ